MSLQKNVSGNIRGEWQDVRIVVDKEASVPAKGLLKLDNEWNNLNVIANETGNYRVYAKFEVLGESIENDWEFEVV